MSTNAGWLAFVDHGSATAPIYAAHRARIPVLLQIFRPDPVLTPILFTSINTATCRPTVEETWDWYACCCDVGKSRLSSSKNRGAGVCSIVDSNSNTKKIWRLQQEKSE